MMMMVVMVFVWSGSADSGVCSPCSYISSPCPPPGRPRYCDPHLSYMDRVVMEIVETEGVYVRDLHQVIQVSDCPAYARRLNQCFKVSASHYGWKGIDLLQFRVRCLLDIEGRSETGKGRGWISSIRRTVLFGGSRKEVVLRLVVVVGVPRVGSLFVDPWRHSLVGHRRLPGTFSPSVPLLPGTGWGILRHIIARQRWGANKVLLTVRAHKYTVSDLLAGDEYLPAERQSTVLIKTGTVRVTTSGLGTENIATCFSIGGVQPIYPAERWQTYLELQQGHSGLLGTKMLKIVRVAHIPHPPAYYPSASRNGEGVEGRILYQGWDKTTPLAYHPCTSRWVEGKGWILHRELGRLNLKKVNPHLPEGQVENHLQVNPTEIRTFRFVISEEKDEAFIGALYYSRHRPRVEQGSPRSIVTFPSSSDAEFSRIPDRDSNLDLTVIDGLVYCESSALEHAITEAGIMMMMISTVWKQGYGGHIGRTLGGGRGIPGVLEVRTGMSSVGQTTGRSVQQHPGHLQLQQVLTTLSSPGIWRDLTGLDNPDQC
uniref:Uncharacterized protein n=1 Tax=Timema poppense TaxID=170557 RepID=A0A7R9DBS1_TIMPO|nr:unnamed protein product [Timema poppensis]